MGLWRAEYLLLLFADPVLLQIYVRDIKKILGCREKKRERESATGIVKPHGAARCSGDGDCISDNGEFYNASRYMGQRKRSAGGKRVRRQR